MTLLQVSTEFWKDADTVTSVFVHVSVIAAAIAALIKFRVLSMFAWRHKSELVCHHYKLPSGKLIFEAAYTIHNTGERPISLSNVRLRLCRASKEGLLLYPDRNHVYAERLFKQSDSDMQGLFKILAGERSIFTLRCELAELDPIVFVICQLTWPHNREPAPFIGMYASDMASKDKVTAA